MAYDFIREINSGIVLLFAQTQRERDTEIKECMSSLCSCYRKDEK